VGAIPGVVEHSRLIVIEVLPILYIQRLRTVLSINRLRSAALLKLLYVSTMTLFSHIASINSNASSGSRSFSCSTRDIAFARRAGVNSREGSVGTGGGARKLRKAKFIPETSLRRPSRALAFVFFEVAGASNFSAGRFDPEMTGVMGMGARAGVLGWDEMPGI
jgi:hypothetical protein